MTALDTLQQALSDRYAIQREIGAGGMATVYLARDLRHQRDVALKVLKPELGAVLGAERFLSEIRVTANLQHPNLLPLFDSGEAGGLLYYVMPFVAGETLRARIDREKQLPVDEAVRIAVAVASALGYAHEHGVIHRDLKPENILIQAGQPVIADFGIALAVSNAGGARVTQTGLSLGTPQYMSPEQAAGDREIDARSDIYSLGAVTYEMLAGEPPHSGTSAQAIIAKLMTKDPAPLHSLRRTVPVNVACAVEKALAKLPADRFATAQEFATALTNPSFTISTGSGAAYVAGGGSKHWKTATIAATAAALVLAAALAWALLRPSPPKPVLRYALGLDTAEAFAGNYGRVAISPDGSRIVYTVQPGNKLMLRERNQLHGTLIPGVDDAYSPEFSPDGSKIVYVGPPSLARVVSLSGGPPITISDSLGPPSATWGTGGRIFSTGANGGGIVQITENPGVKPVHITRVDSAQGETWHRWPAALPNGKGILFTILYGKGKPSAIAAADIATGKYHVLVMGARAEYSPSGHLLYTTADGTLMAAPFDQDALRLTGDPVAISEAVHVGAIGASDFGVARNGTLFYTVGGGGADREVVWVGRDGKSEEVDPSWKGTFTYPTLSPDGRQLAVVLAAPRSGNLDIWVKQLDKGPSLKLTFEGSVNIYPTWTPDGRSITFEGNAAGTQDLWTKRADGSAQAVVQLHLKRDLAESRWSRDGKWLILRTSTNSPGAGDILAMRPGVDSAPISIASSSFAELAPALSPDGRWLAYVSNETGRQEIFVVPFPNSGAAKWPVSTQGGSQPLWSHSGRELFYRNANDDLISVAVNPGASFSMGASTKLFSAKEFVGGGSHPVYDVSPDDKRFLFLRSATGVSLDKLIFVENWFEELKKKK